MLSPMLVCIQVLFRSDLQIKNKKELKSVKLKEYTTV